ncbi:MAG: Holliday junction branch migration protein RuvA [Leptolinea sp.]|jgi:Holliday junction DNA helicase RuvA|nr:Holliday junction branch migration protein RuvA [Leptolinea sp.]
MIAAIRGEVIGRGEDHLVVETGGIGFKVFTTQEMTVRIVVGDPVFLFTHLVVREDALSLYGFETEEIRDLFVLLLGVNGVGPRIALAILSCMSPDAIRRSVISEQPDLFARVSGVGKKTAQKIILYLQGKVSGELTVSAEPGTIEVDAQVLDALTGLGYSIVEAQAAIQSIPRGSASDVETRLRLALQYFSN